MLPRLRSRARITGPGDRAEQQTPTGAGRAETGRLQAPDWRRRVSRSHEFPDPGGRGFGFVCLKEEEPLGHKLPLPSPPFSETSVKLKMATVLASG